MIRNPLMSFLGEVDGSYRSFRKVRPTSNKKHSEGAFSSDSEPGRVRRLCAFWQFTALRQSISPTLLLSLGENSGVRQPRAEQCEVCEVELALWFLWEVWLLRLSYVSVPLEDREDETKRRWTWVLQCSAGAGWDTCCLHFLTAPFMSCAAFSLKNAKRKSQSLCCCLQKGVQWTPFCGETLELPPRRSNTCGILSWKHGADNAENMLKMEV